MKVYSLLYCRTDIDLPGSLLFFPSLRIGFPNCEIILVDNANPPEYKSIFAKKAKEIGLEVQDLLEEVSHEEFVENLIITNSEPFYVIDPDTMYFDSMEKSYDAALAGRYIPKFTWKASSYNEKTQALPTIHSCCMYIDPIRYTSILEKNKINRLMVKPTTFDIKGNTWWDYEISRTGEDINLVDYAYDIMSEFYNHFSDHCQKFTDDENSKFAHLICGSHLSLAITSHSFLSEMHQKAMTDIEYAKNLYKEQDAMYRRYPWRDGVAWPINVPYRQNQ